MGRGFIVFGQFIISSFCVLSGGGVIYLGVECDSCKFTKGKKNAFIFFGIVLFFLGVIMSWYAFVSAPPGFMGT